MLSMQGNSINKFYYHHSRLPSSHIKHTHKAHMDIGEMALLRNDNNEQVSPISEGVMEI
jgi:hypothetical protein